MKTSSRPVNADARASAMLCIDWSGRAGCWERWASESPLQVAFACYNQKAAAPLPPARSGRRLHVPYRSNRPAS